MQNPEFKKVPHYTMQVIETPSCTFFIPVNAAGEELSEMAQDEDYDEQERFSRWFEQKQEQDLLNQQNRL